MFLKKNTALNIDEVKNVTDMMGQFIDQENPYITCSNDYIDTKPTPALSRNGSEHIQQNKKKNRLKARLLTSGL